jgi:hypothetical protein
MRESASGVTTEELSKAVKVDTYLDVDLSLSSDGEWLLALWGLRDSRHGPDGHAC